MGDYEDWRESTKYYPHAFNRVVREAWDHQQEKITALESALRDCVTHMKTAGSPEAVRACETAEKLLGVER